MDTDKNFITVQDSECEKICSDKLKQFISNLPANQITLLSSLLGIALVDGLTPDEQNILGNILVNIGQTILTSAAINQSCKSSDSNT